MKTKNNRAALFVKVFLVLFITGFVLPNLISLVVDKVLMINDKVPSGNSIFVMHNGTYEISFKDIFFKTLRKMINF
jgi:hypothetical protein